MQMRTGAYKALDAMQTIHMWNSTVHKTRSQLRVNTFVPSKTSYVYTTHHNPLDVGCAHHKSNDKIQYMYVRLIFNTYV